MILLIKHICEFTYYINNRSAKSNQGGVIIYLNGEFCGFVQSPQKMRGPQSKKYKPDD